MIEYNKIETLYERDIEGTKRLIEGQYRNETVEFLKDVPWEFTEKIDGTNIRIHWDGHKVNYGGRTDRKGEYSGAFDELLDFSIWNE